MKKLSLAAFALGAVLSLGQLAQAATVQVFSKDYGAHDTGILLSDKDSPVVWNGNTIFSETFDLSSVNNTISSVDLLVRFREVSADVVSELWAVNGLSLTDVSLVGKLEGVGTGWVTQTFSLSGGVLASIQANKSLSVWFNELTMHKDTFYLQNLTLRIAAVPVPAAGLLMLGALGGLGLLRRRKAKLAA